MATTSKETLAVVTQAPKYGQAQDHKYIYVNGARMAISPWDLRIVYSTAKDIGGDTINEDQVTVVMSPQHAKAALRNWATTIKKYEDIFGVIPDLTDLLETAKKNKGNKIELPEPKTAVARKTPRKDTKS